MLCSCNNGSNNEANFDSMLQDSLNNNDSIRLCSYEMGGTTTSPNIIMNSCNFSTQDASPPLASNSSGDSSTITTCDGGGLATSFPMNSSASYLIQSLFDDCDESHQVLQQQEQPINMPHHQFINNSSNNNNNNYGCSLDSSNEVISSNSWVKTSPIPLLQSNKLDGGISALINDHGQVFSGQYSPTTLNSIRASLLNSLQSRSRAPSSSTSLANKVMIIIYVSREGYPDLFF